MLHKKTLIALAAAVALGCVPVATNALAAGHQNGGHGGGGQASAGRAGGGQSFAGRGGSGRAMAGPARGADRLATLVADVSSDPAVAATTAAAVVATTAAGRSTTAAPVMATATMDAPAMVFPLSAP